MVVDKTKHKTDRDDALKLAKMAVMGVLTPVHVPKPEIREQRAIIKYRKNLDGRINRIKNGIRSSFANRGIEIDSGARAWHTGRVHIDSFRTPITLCNADDLWKGQLDLELTQLDALTAEMQAVEDRLELFAADNAMIQLVMTIPGVGRKTAELLVAIIDAPHRFKSARHLSSYLGLTPKQYQSGETDGNGRISKRGPKLARTMLLECAWVSLRYNDWSKKTFERIHGGSKTRRKKAGIALARKIAVVAWAMMRDQKAWDPNRALQESAAEPEIQELTTEDTETQESKPKRKAKLIRAKPHAPGPVISDEPKQRSGRGSKPTRRRGSARRAPLKT
ncbi:Transposase IS116/IS110/IS902 family protein [Novipirellula aureliae]|uniref:Transposase IS116/IS110/IS902 family protein n=1 Tax=Novipirellula aureliae TaxID=2527966 RepID=A0A5C6DSF5_9BACT|nr:Transposase IS116/IS110/IS902 family protein [Novipirellula aureliae]